MKKQIVTCLIVVTLWICTTASNLQAAPGSDNWASIATWTPGKLPCIGDTVLLGTSQGNVSSMTISGRARASFVEIYADSVLIFLPGATLEMPGPVVPSVFCSVNTTYPAILPSALIPTYAGQSLSVPATLNIPLNMSLHGLFSTLFQDNNGEQLTYTVHWASSLNSTLVNAQSSSWLSYDTSTDTLIGTPVASALALTISTFTASATDSSGTTTLPTYTFKFTVNVGKRPPYVTLPANFPTLWELFQGTTMSANTVYYKLLVGTIVDPDNFTLTYTLSGLDQLSGLALDTNPSTPLDPYVAISGVATALGSWPVTFTGTNTVGQSASFSFTIKIINQETGSGGTGASGPTATPTSPTESTSPTPSTSTPSTPTPSTSPNEATSSTDTAAIAGGAAGGAIALILIIFFALFCLRRRQDGSKSNTNLESRSGYEIPLSTSNDGDGFPRDRNASNSSNFSRQENIYIPSGSLKLGSFIAEGNFGQVVQADYNGAQVAVKMLNKTAQDAATRKENMLEEAQMMNSIPPQPNVLHYYGVSEQDGEFLMVTELCNRGSLLRYLQDDKSKLTLTQSREICAQIASGMWHLSKNGILHRDLRADNILLSGENNLQVKVADFGLARKLQNAKDNRGSAYFRMTEIKPIPLAWTAPEVFVAGHTYVAASDVWSFGIVMWEIYTRGSKPFDGLSPEAISSIVCNPTRSTPLLPLPDKCPKNIFNIMNACWAFDPQKRPTFEQLYNQLVRE